MTNLIKGLAINEKMIYTGSFFDLFSAYTIVGGLTFLTLFLFHGALFITLKVEGDLINRAGEMAKKIGIVAGTSFALCGILTYTNTDLFNSMLATISLILAVVLLGGNYCLS